MCLIWSDIVSSISLRERLLLRSGTMHWLRGWHDEWASGRCYGWSLRVILMNFWLILAQSSQIFDSSSLAIIESIESMRGRSLEYFTLSSSRFFRFRSWFKLRLRCLGPLWWHGLFQFIICFTKYSAVFSQLLGEGKIGGFYIISNSLRNVRFWDKSFTNWTVEARQRSSRLRNTKNYNVCK